MESHYKGKCDIIVAGDLTIDWLLWSTKYIENFEYNNLPNWALYPGTQMRAEKGGVLLLAMMVKEATSARISTYVLENIEAIPSESVVRSISILDTFLLNKNEGEYSKKNKVFRIKNHCGFSGPIKGKARLLPISNDSADADMVILDDAGNGFRNEKDIWPKAILKEGKSPIIILKMSQPLASGALWDHLTKDQNVNSNNLVLIIDANDLRKLGFDIISKHLSWEQTAEDFLWQMSYNPRIKSIAACRNLIVRLGLEGVIHYTNIDGKTDAFLYCDPYFGEDGYRKQYEGDMQGLTAAFVAAFSAEVAKEGIEGIENGIFEGIQKSRRLLELGFGDARNEPSYPIRELFEYSKKHNTICKVNISFFRDKASKNKKKWRILEEFTRGRLESIAYNTVTNKTEDVFRHVPGARFGKLFILDREEIESFQNIKNSMEGYLEKTDINVPLSIAVFGPPGSGKSFSITELALSLDHKRVEKIEFNVSLFTSLADLASAFYKIRDLIIRGKIPLVFFYEFDVAFDGKFGWLKHFLAPMQEGMFKGGDAMHHIGRSIFVFVGGASYTFEHFSRTYFDEAVRDDERKNMKKKFLDAKGLDFVSQLSGYVNILGVNRTGPEDDLFILRRAFLLRSLLQKKAPQIFDNQGVARIDSGVLRAFLKVPTYNYGARSMEAVINLSTLAKRRQFTQSALPPSKLLDMHVNSEIFLKLVSFDVFFSDSMERMAIITHAQYVIEHTCKKDPSDPVMKPWEDLSENCKDKFRNLVTQIPEKLQKIGCDLVPFIEKPQKRFVFSEEQIEILAEMEHEQWVYERMKNGWRLGNQIESVKKITPDLIPWSELDEKVKNRYVNQIRKIPERLEACGFEVYRLH